jgi:hypothetical protein
VFWCIASAAACALRAVALLRVLWALAAICREISLDPLQETARSAIGLYATGTKSGRQSGRSHLADHDVRLAAHVHPDRAGRPRRLIRGWCWSKGDQETAKQAAKTGAPPVPFGRIA